MKLGDGRPPTLERIDALVENLSELEELRRNTQNNKKDMTAKIEETLDLMKK